MVSRLRIARYRSRAPGPRNQRWAGSASSRGCQSIETVKSSDPTGSGKHAIRSAQRLRVALRDAGNEVARSRQADGGGKAADDDGGLAGKAAASLPSRSVSMVDVLRLCRAIRM